MATKRDFRGLELCPPCWAGQHFGYRKNEHGKPIARYCLCHGGGCECPCRSMDEDEAEQAERRMARRKRQREAQMRLFP